MSRDDRLGLYILLLEPVPCSLRARRRSARGFEHLLHAPSPVGKITSPLAGNDAHVALPLSAAAFSLADGHALRSGAPSSPRPRNWASFHRVRRTRQFGTHGDAWLSRRERCVRIAFIHRQLALQAEVMLGFPWSPSEKGAIRAYV